MVWQLLLWKKAVNNDMVFRLGQLETLLRTKLLNDGLKDIKSFATSKNVAVTKFKRRSTFDAKSFLTQRHFKVMRAWFGRYKARVFDAIQRTKRLRAIYNNINA